MFNEQIMYVNGFPKDFVTRKTPVTLFSRNDDTLAMTATILLYSRVDDLKIDINTYKANYHMNDISTDDKVYSFYFYDGFNDEKEVDKLMDNVPQSIKTIGKLPAHEKFMKEQTKKNVYIRLMPEVNNVCIFVQDYTLQMFHLVQSFIPKFFPIFKDKPLTNDEKLFLETLTHKTPHNYAGKLAEFVNKDEFRKFSLSRTIGNIESKMFEKKLASARARVNRLLDDMEEYMRRYKETYNKYQEAQYLASGIELTANGRSERSELQEYLIKNKTITNISVKDDYLEFVVKTFLAPHHIGEWDVMNRRGMAERYQNVNFTAEEIAMLLDAIFSKDRCLKLRICAFFSMDYFGSEVRTQPGYKFATYDPTLKDYVPNGHLHHNSCFGQNKEAILMNLKQGEVVGAIECCIACTQRMNIHEDFSFKPFVKDLLDCKGKCLVAKDGTEYTPREAIEYLKGKSNEVDKV